MKSWVVVYHIEGYLEYERFETEAEARVFALSLIKDEIKESEVVIIHIGDIFIVEDGKFQLH